MTLSDAARRIADDRDSGSAELLARALPVLADAIAAGRSETELVARTIGDGQPTMTVLLRACRAALSGSFEAVRRELERSPALLARAAAIALTQAFGATPPRILTMSFSRSVYDALAIVCQAERLSVICAEGRPRLEGRRLAAQLSDVGCQVTLVTDAALTSYLSSAAAVIVGADALLPDAWINKVGTFGVAAAAAWVGAPVYVIASRYKVVPRGVELPLVLGDPAELWSACPAPIAVENRYFERCPAELATLFLTESGGITPSDLPKLCERYAPSPD